MKSVDRFLLATAGVAVLAGCTGGGSGSASPAPAQQAGAGEARIARGKYLVDHVGICMYCHSAIDWKAPGHPQVAGSQGGGAVFPDKAVPGRVVARNITPAAIGDCSDAEITRAIREGVGCDGSHLFPAMPYHFFRAMSDDDVASVVAYLRTLAPIENELPKNEIPAEVWASLPPPEPVSQPVPTPDRADKPAYGRYLATIGLCVECHTPVDPTGAPLHGLDFAGGRILDGPWGRVASANLTPDASGIPYYDEALFKDVLRTCKVKSRELNHIMPCEYYKGLSDEDVSAIFSFVRSLPPVAHDVNNVDEATACRRCGQPHGLGARNEPMPAAPASKGP